MAHILYMDVWVARQHVSVGEEYTSTHLGSPESAANTLSSLVQKCNVTLVHLAMPCKENKELLRESG